MVSLYILITLSMILIIHFFNLIDNMTCAIFNNKYFINDRFLLFNMMWRFYIFDRIFYHYYSQINNNKKCLMYKYYEKGYEDTIHNLSLKDLFIIHKPMYICHDYNDSVHDLFVSIFERIEYERYRLRYYNDDKLRHLWISNKIIKFDKLF